MLKIELYSEGMAATTLHLLLGLGLGCGAARSADKPPNVLFIVADDLGQ